MAKRAGMNIRQFVAATNVNDVVPEYLVSGQFKRSGNLFTRNRTHAATHKREIGYCGSDAIAFQTRRSRIGLAFECRDARIQCREVPVEVGGDERVACVPRMRHAGKRDGRVQPEQLRSFDVAV